ncbi:hypothetical protein ACH5RR_025749 [Cinchona calisaya]|uniref:FBD domain-containing protein n=1 Tax=Cinchona calisaya TaxID=153742 RepID=A0ABD2Z4J3_9GENT
MNSSDAKFARQTSDDNGDTLSTLHDSILSHILSFLPTKLAASTSILSTRWKHIIFSVPRLDLDDSFLLNNPQKEDVEDDEGEEAQPQSQPPQNFIEFVNRILLSRWARDSFPVYELRLRCRHMPRNVLLKSWISASLSPNIRHLDVCIEKQKDHTIGGVLPSELFSCKALEVLKFRGRVVLKIPKLASLPKLKVLRLELLILIGDSTTWKFSEKFPMLDDLKLDSISLRNFSGLDISLPLLRELELGLFDLGRSLPEFRNLTYEEIMASHDYEWQLLPDLLQRAPNLEMLVCDLEKCKRTSRGLEYPEETETLSLAQHLREVKISHFVGLEFEFKLVRYILKHGKVLENITIRASEDDYSSSIWKKLFKLSACFQNCVVDFKFEE